LARQCDDSGLSKTVFVEAVKENKNSLKIILVLLACTGLAACGYRGALYLPEQAPKTEPSQTIDPTTAEPESTDEPK